MNLKEDLYLSTREDQATLKNQFAPSYLFNNTQAKHLKGATAIICIALLAFSIFFLCVGKWEMCVVLLALGNACAYVLQHSIKLIERAQRANCALILSLERYFNHILEIEKQERKKDDTRST